MAWRLVLEARCRPTPANGHADYTPSLTGMGDRAHLLSSDITIDTFVEDLARVILTEELTEVVLVGHSVGGVPIAGVADRLPEFMAHLAWTQLWWRAARAPSPIIRRQRSRLESMPPCSHVTSTRFRVFN
jgi:pimeloyl-ACP methyl ester carboxylesterase